MPTNKPNGSSDDFLDLPYLLRRYPEPPAGRRSRVASEATPRNDALPPVAPVAPSAGYNPYFDLLPDTAPRGAPEPGRSR